MCKGKRNRSRGEGKEAGVKLWLPDATSAPSLLLCVANSHPPGKAGTQPSRVKLFLSRALNAAASCSAAAPKCKSGVKREQVARCSSTSFAFCTHQQQAAGRGFPVIAHTCRLMGATRAISKKCMKFVVRISAGKSAAPAHNTQHFFEHSPSLPASPSYLLCFWPG